MQKKPNLSVSQKKLMAITSQIKRIKTLGETSLFTMEELEAMRDELIARCI